MFLKRPHLLYSRGQYATDLRTSLMSALLERYITLHVKDIPLSDKKYFHVVNHVVFREPRSPGPRHQGRP